MSIDLFALLIAAASLAAGALASVTGFGIGSLLTPALASSLDARVAVAAVSIPHLAGTALRFWMLRGHVDRRVFWRFGLMSAAGGLAGALLHTRATSPALMILFGALLIFVAISQVTGLARRMRFHGPAAWVAGGTSGLLGGLVGNQGGIRSAALLGFDLRPETFVATATAIGLVVDAARMPVYFALYPGELVSLWPIVALASAGVLAGTFAGRRLLARIPERWFRRMLALVLAALGAFMLLRARTTETGTMSPGGAGQQNLALSDVGPRRDTGFETRSINASAFRFYARQGCVLRYARHGAYEVFLRRFNCSGTRAYRLGRGPGASMALTVTMAANPGADQRAIAYMKTYLSVAPPSPDRERALSAASLGVPVLEPGECHTGLKALLLSAKTSN